MKLLWLLPILALGFGGTAAAAVDVPPWEAVGYYAHPDIRESSGIVASRQFEGVYWTLNDSGNPATLYATDRTGTLIQEIAVTGARNVDWEALGIDDRNQLWIGEIGNNSRQRMDLKVFVIAEPNPFTETAAPVLARYPYRYPSENVDAEGLFIVAGVPYIVSKELGRAVLYRFPVLRPDVKQVLVRVGEFRAARLVTGAGLSEDGTRLAVCSYDALWVYHNAAGDVAAMLHAAPWSVQHDFSGEAVCFDGNDLVLTNEARELYVLPQFWYEQEWRVPPRETQSAVDLVPRIRGGNAVIAVADYRAEGIDIGGSHVTFTPEVAGARASLTLPVSVPHSDLYEIRAVLTRGPGFGEVDVSIDGVAVGEPYSCYAEVPRAGDLVSFGAAPLDAGENLVTFSSLAKIGVAGYQVLHASPFVKQYAVLGPLPERVRFGTPIDVDRVHTGIAGEAVQWREVSARADGLLDLRAALGPTPMAVGYVRVSVHAPKAMESVMLIGSDDETVVWLNGSEIYRHQIDAWATADADAVPCQLKAGWNTVVCEKVDRGWSWGLYLRFTDAEEVLDFSVF